MRHGYAGHRHRGPVPELQQAARAAGEQDRTLGGDRHDRATGGLCRPLTARGADGARGGRGECAPVVRVDVSHSKTRRLGVAQMRKTVRRASYVVRGALCVGMLLGSPLAAQTSVSIYRDGRVVVRRTLPQALQQGRNALTLRLEALDPATLFSTDSSVSIASATVRYPTTKADALGRAIGQTLSFVRSVGDTVKAAVVRVDPPQYRLPDGRLLLEQPGEPLFPAELVRTGPEAQLVLDAARSRQRTEIAYVALGMTWEALYQVIVSGARAQVTGTATVTSQGLRADSADVQLVAGAIRRTRAPAAPMPMMDAIVLRGQTAGVEAKTAQEESVGETHVYQLPGQLTIEPKMPVSSALFPR